MTYYSDSVVLPTSPIAYWKLNESAGSGTVSDSSGNSCTGTVHGPTFAAGTSPDGTPAPYFDGLNDYIDVTSANFSSVFDGDLGSMMVWFKADTSLLTDTTLHELVAIYNVGITRRVSIEKKTTDYRFSGFRTGGTNGGDVTDTEWHCIILTWNLAENRQKFFLDGVPADYKEVSLAWTGGISQANIGTFDTFQWWWQGYLSHVTLWDYELNNTTIADLSDTSVPAPPPPYIPDNLYEILVYDHSGTLQLILQKWSRVEFHQRTNAPWNHQITLEFGYDDPDLAIIRNILPDWIIEIYRTDPITGISNKVYEGFNTTIVDQVRINGGIIINMYGVGYTQLLQRRLALPTTGEEYSVKTGVAETVIKSFVSENMVGTSDPNRTFPGVSVAADLGTGAIITYSARYINLLSVCETCSERGDLDFGIYGGQQTGKFIFDARDIWGKDLRESNPVGNIPVVFSIERDNMLIPILSLNYSGEQNYAYVGGDGQGADRIIQEVYDPVAVARSPWSRKEVFVEARQQSTLDALFATGDEELQSRKAKQTLSFNIKQTDSTRWIRDWNLGDLISAKYYSYVFDKQITEIGVVVSSSASNYEVITVEFEDLRT